MTTQQNQNSKSGTSPLYGYIDNKRKKIGYAYFTQSGMLCIRGDKLLDKNQLGRLLQQGLYVDPPANKKEPSHSNDGS